MDKLNRVFNETKMNESKTRTIDFVMEEIIVEKRRQFSFNKRLMLSMSLTIFLVLIMLSINTGSNGPGTSTYVLNAASISRVSEATYITGNLLASETFVNSSMLQMLSDDDSFDFETDIDEFNKYFDVLKVFLDDDPIDIPEITEYVGEDYQNTIRYMVEGNEYVFHVNYDGEKVIGELIVGTIVYQVTGTIIETKDDTSVDIESRSGSNYIKLKYVKEQSTETETKYEIESNINGVYREKEIKVERGLEESSVEIHENENEYSLKKELEDSGVVYKLEYKIGTVEGEAEITEHISNGVKQYAYNIEEDGKQKEIDKDNPNHFGHEKDEDEEDVEDDEDENGNKSQGNN